MNLEGFDDVKRIYVVIIKKGKNVNYAGF